MAKRVRKTAEERREELLDVAASLFVEKGFQATTMEDVVAASGMSKGGVYHYFKSTEDLLYALMQRGSRYRMAVFREELANYSQPPGLAFLADGIINKMLDQGPLISIYVMFLQEVKRNPRLAALLQRLEEETSALVEEAPEELRVLLMPAVNDPFLIGIINTFLLGCDVLEKGAVFEEHRDYLKVMIMTYLEDKIRKGHST